jgi:hypothetical protein
MSMVMIYKIGHEKAQRRLVAVEDFAKRFEELKAAGARILCDVSAPKETCENTESQ